MKFESLLLEQKYENKQIWTLTINRSQNLNALNSHVLRELEQALIYISEMNFSECRVLIVTGAGEKAFIAGADIKEMSNLHVEGGREFALMGQKIFRQIEKLKIPVIAAVNGFALGGGLELALACDFIYASENAKLGLPEVSLGLIPGFGGTVRLSRAVGLAKAKEMIFTGDMMTAQEAYNVGLVNKVIPQAELMNHVLKATEMMISRGPVALKHAKTSVMSAYDQDVDSGLRTEAQEFSHLFSTADFKEGTAAFVEKRKPSFLGK